jgi:hypothetical protein
MAQILRVILIQIMNITTQLAVTEINKYLFQKNIIQTKLIMSYA